MIILDNYLIIKNYLMKINNNIKTIIKKSNNQ